MFTRRSRSGQNALAVLLQRHGRINATLIGTLPWQTWRCGSEAGRFRWDNYPCSLGCSPQRSSSFRSPSWSGASFFNGWRSAPGMMPATSQLPLLSSTTPINVSLRSNGAKRTVQVVERLLLLFRLAHLWAPSAGLTSAPMEPSLGLQFVY